MDKKQAAGLTILGGAGLAIGSFLPWGEVFGITASGFRPARGNAFTKRRAASLVLRTNPAASPTTRCIRSGPESRPWERLLGTA